MSDESAQVPESMPSAADPQSVEGLFLAALGQASAEEREAFLNEACGDDVVRRRRVEALLRAYEDAGSFLEKPPVGAPGDATVSLAFLTPADDPGLLGMLGPYEVYEMLGRGGMGIVFRARDPKLNRVVAIKVLAPELAANPNARRRFLREAQAAAAISHPHVVTIHAVDEGSAASSTPAAESSRGASSLPFIVMECIVGQTLQQKLDKRGSLRLTEILRIGHQVAAGLAAAHTQGLIHRDIKPANVLLENGVERVKITDFGLARAADDVSITRTGEVSGTPQYMSPEQASGGTIDHRSDLFSLGCVLYAMCTGRSPFRATTLAAAIRRVCDDTPRPIEEINPEVPHWLIDIVNQLLEKNPDDRIQSASEVDRLLGEHLAGVQHPAGVRRPPSLRRSPAPRRTAASVPSAPSRRGVGVSVPLRALVWLGAIALLVPVFIAIGGTAFGAGGDSLEGAVIAAIICIPIAVVIFAVAMLDRSVQGLPWANALFLLCCILLGPIGILLYLVRRDQYLATSTEQTPTVPPRDEGADRAGPDETQNAPVPQWLMTPLPGPLKVIAALLLVASGLVMGQGIEQWSDVSEPVGVALFAAALLLGLLAFQTALATGVRFRALHWLAMALGILPLLYLGAQLPDREFKRGLAGEADMVALFTLGLFVLALPISLLLWGLTQPDDRDSGGRSRRDRLGSGLISCSFLIWGALVVWMLLVAVGAINPPPFSARGWIGIPIMIAVVFGGLLLGAGMILQHRVVTPGLVRQVAMATDARSQRAASQHVPAPPDSGGTSPWRILGWMVVAGVVVIPGCFITITMLAIPYFAQAKPPRGVVQIEFDNDRPVVKVIAQQDIDLPPLQQRPRYEYAVTTNPFSFDLPKGVYALTMTYHADGQTGTFTQRVQVTPGGTRTLDVRPNIAIAHQFEHLDKRTMNEAGETIGEDAAGMPPGGIPEGIGMTPAGAQGAVLLTITDPGLSIRFERTSEEPAEGQTDDGAAGVMSEYGGGLGPPGTGMGGFAELWQHPRSESGTVKLPAGTYRVIVYDELAGWGRAKTVPGPMRLVPGTELESPIKVVAGEFQKLTVRRDLKRVAALVPDWDQPGFFAFRWNGETYDLSRNQAVVVQRLLEFYAADQADVAEVILTLPEMVPVDATMTKEQASQLVLTMGAIAASPEALFNDGQHPAWKQLIVPGRDPNTYRLLELDTKRPKSATESAVINVVIEDAGLRVLLERLDNKSQIISTEDPIDTSKWIHVAPGQYRVVIEDDVAGWHSQTDDGETGPVRYVHGVYDFPAGQITTLSIRRNVLKMTSGRPLLLPGVHKFRWNGTSYELTQNQAVAVLRLLIAYSHGEPDVHEGALLRDATFQGVRIMDEPMTRREAEEYLKRMTERGHSLKGQFDNGQHSAWGTLVIEGEQPNTYRLPELKVTDVIPAATPPATETVPNTQPIVVGSLSPGQFERAGQLMIDIKDDGFQVAVRRKSAFDSYVPGSEQQVTELGRAYLRVHPGEYELLVRDKLFGWGDRVKSITVGETESPTVTVKRDLAKYSQDVRDRSADFLWDGTRYEIGSRYGQFLVNRLLRAFTDAAPEVEAETLLKELLAERDKGHKGLPERLDIQPYQDEQPLEELALHLFPGALGAQSDVWGKLIVPGQAEGTYRLAPLNLGTLNLTGFDPGMQVHIEPVKKDPRFSSRWITADVQLPVPPGEYVCSVSDANVQWGLWTKKGWAFGFGFGLPPARQQTINIRKGEETTISGARQWSDYLNPPEPKEGEEEIAFTWFPKRSSTFLGTAYGSGGFFSGGQPDGIVDLDQAQFRIVLALLKAHVAGAPEVAEEDLLGQDGVDAETWAEVFPELGGGADGLWKTVIVPGEAEGTWRLKPPPVDESE